MNFDSQSKEELIQEIKKLRLEKEAAEKKLAEFKEIEEFEGLAKYTVDSISDSIFWIGKYGKFLFVNESACRNLGYTKKELLTMGVVDIDPTYPKEKITKAWDNIKDFGMVVFETTHTRKDGKTIPVEITGEFVTYNGKTYNCVFARDISERKKVEEELQKQNSILEAQYEQYMQLYEELRTTNYDLELAREKAEESNRAKSIFLANMSHELRTPLFGMLGYSEMLMMLLEEEELSEMATGINRTGKRLLNTLSLILDLSRVEADNFEINTGKHNSIKILQEVYDNLKGSALTKNLAYKFESHVDELIVNTDPEMFRIIFENLVGNAIKFTEEGSVVLSTELINDNILSVKVSDTGIGIDNEDIPIVFELFKQLSEGTTKNFQGSGLGLSITKKLVELLDGSIEIISEKGIGTSVIVNFPI